MAENTDDNPLIVQSDRTILLDLHSPLAYAAREKLAHFSELVKSQILVIDFVHFIRFLSILFYVTVLSYLSEKYLKIL